jgi:thiosulfate dehydrogenase
MKKFLFGVVLTLVVLAVGVGVFFAGGFAPVATSAPPLPFERQLAMLAVHARAKKEMPKTVPIKADEPNELAGARLYTEHCAVCHGLPNQPETAIARGEFPPPPQLFGGQGVTDDPAGETWWKVKNGIRLTGMPGFEKSLSDTQMWQVSLLLANATGISPAVAAALRNEPAAMPPSQPAPMAPSDPAP